MLNDDRITTEFTEANGLRFEVDQGGSVAKPAFCLHGQPVPRVEWQLRLIDAPA